MEKGGCSDRRRMMRRGRGPGARGVFCFSPAEGLGRGEGVRAETGGGPDALG